MNKHIVTGTEVIAWVEKELDSTFPQSTALGLVREGQLVAGVVYDNYNGVNINTHIVIKGRMTKRYLWSIFHYPFEYLGVKRITGLVGEGNKASRAFCRNLGFTVEAALKDCHPTGKLFVYRMMKNECRFLDMMNATTKTTTRHCGVPNGAPPMRVVHEEAAQS